MTISLSILDPTFAANGLEANWVELPLPKSKGILVCVVYRPPNDGGFLQKLETSLSGIDPGTEVYILGDLNIDFCCSCSLLKRLKGNHELFWSFSADH